MHVRRATAGAVAIVVLCAVVVLAAGGSDAPVATTPSSPATAQAAVPQLPGGGRSILPEHRVLAHYGAPQAVQLGILGIGSPAVAGKRLTRQAKQYAKLDDRPVLPAMELIGVIVNATPGSDGKFRTRQSDALIGRYLKAARASGAILVLDIQPGRSDFLTEAKAFERWLKEPDVGLALDPEWRMAPGQIPGRVIGSVDAAELNAVTAWLAGVVKRGNLPDKLVVVHQFTDGMIRRRAGLRARPGLDIVLNADGFGTPSAKTATYGRVVARRGPFHAGFKLFFVEDTNLMSPAAVARLRPRPELVIYE